MTTSVGPVLRPVSDRQITDNGIPVDPVIAALPDGGYILAWSTLGLSESWSRGPDDDHGIFWQRYSPDGTPLGDPSRVDPANNRAGDPELLVNPDGGFLISWTEYTEAVWAQNFTPDGLPQAGPVQFDLGSQFIDLEAGLAVIWQSAPGSDTSNQIFGRLLDQDGIPRDDPFLIAAGDVGQPEAVPLRNGGFAVLWSEEPTEGSSGERLLLRSFEADGSSPAPAVAITEDVGYTIDYSLIELADGGFLVNWRARGLEGYDYENYASRFAADGTPLGEIFSIPQRTVGSEREIQFSSLADDFILATWNSYDFLTLEQDGDRSVGVYSTLFGRILAPNGETVGAEFQVFQIRSGGSLSRPDFALTPDGSVIVTAHDYVSVSERYYERYENSELVTVRFDLQPGMPGMIGSVGDDRLTGGPEDEVLRGLEGDDVIDGGSGDDAVEGGPGGDTLFGGDGNDTIDGGPGTKEYRYRSTEGMFEARNKLHGGAGDDLILGGQLRDEITGGSGADRIFGYSGNDLIYGQDGNDTIAGGFGVDELIGQNGDDVINGSAYSDLIFGGDGDDYVNGGFGFDRINGGAGADLFYHAGNEGHGSDWLQDYSAAEGDVLVFGGAGASASDFVVRFAHTATPAGERSGDDEVQEAFVNFRGQTLWALVDGAGEAQINLQIGGDTFDLLA